MSYSLVSRDIMAAMVEIHALGHPHDGMVLVSGNDKSVPAHLVAMARCDLPAIHLPGGTQLNAPDARGGRGGLGGPQEHLEADAAAAHAAYYSEEAIHTVRDFAAHEVVRVLTGQPPVSPVNANQLTA